MLLRTPKHRMVLQVAGWAKIPANQMLVLTFLVRNPTAQTAGDTPRLTLSHGVGADGTPGGGALRLGPLVAGYMRGVGESPSDTRRCTRCWLRTNGISKACCSGATWAALTTPSGRRWA